jgi:Fe-S oxidoreductase
MLGISGRRKLPTFASQRFSQWFARHPAFEGGRPVILFLDTYTETMCPEVGQAAVAVLEASGCRVLLAQGQGCCGRPMISKGVLGRAKQMAERNLRALSPHADAGIPILGLEPSCLLTLRDEYLEFFPRDPRARRIADGSLLVEEYLVRRDADGTRPLDRVQEWAPSRGGCVVHGHCYTKALVGMQPTREMLHAAGWEPREVDAGCCGMAGSFGYEAEHLELSVQIAEQRLLPGVRAAAAAGQAVYAPGFSCRTQIQDGAGVRAQHPVQAVAAMLGPRSMDEEPGMGGGSSPSGRGESRPG